MTKRARVVVYLKGDVAAVSAAYRQISWVTTPIDGLLSAELLCNAEDDSRFAVLSEWASLQAFRDWQNGPDHQGNPSAVRPFQDRSQGPHYAVYEVD
ncbi:hypothetical protein Lesp02_60190 [Lentzea sp. NBRC 105346]|uniref:antibiotic biosynthesis monooxygenase family protein n=1 Tax=Lentzea sp. NBRC 105346 TaxID=3032205 RepID=UPI002554DAD5|nr:antibiotic biosynthesis monooxygenase family protein [Lentzea sp. NBRC 105346]GLZ33831.1 hypothetical protein Lesp02_60190 [Lentzea sp. NBRC 105346]